MKHLEVGFKKVFDRYISNLPPDHIFTNEYDKSTNMYSSKSKTAEGKKSRKQGDKKLSKRAKGSHKVEL